MFGENMGFVKDLFGKEPKDVRIQDIQSLIENKVEEDRHLDYKAPSILKSPHKLSEWVSAFLNAEGGLIIIGVYEDQPEKKDKIYERILPTRIEFVSREYTKERIEQLIHSNIRSDSRPVIGVHPVRDDADFSKAVYLLEIPEGDNPPYQAADDRYYRRLNATKYPMTHREVADFFGRRRKPLLEVTLNFTEISLQESIYQFTLRVYLVNKGKAVAKYTRLVASFVNLEILKATKDIQRIDTLRGIPSIQYDNIQGVFHPSPRRTYIADVTLKVKDNTKPIIIDYDLVAEDMELANDKYSFDIQLLIKARELLNQGRQPSLIHISGGEPPARAEGDTGGDSG
jgi:hypothetical protein